jgi:hypothetical protein
MVTVSLPEAVGVTALILYTGVSMGWHVGRGMSWIAERRKEGATLSGVIGIAIWRAAHHYDLGLVLATIGLALLVGAPPIERLAGWALLGFGLGMAYDDRADHPPGGIVRHMVGRVRGATS